MIGVLPEAYFLTFATRINPTPTMVSEIQSLHTTIRGLFDDGSYETFLQGSYRNDTATKNINDVDIVILRKRTVSGVYAKENIETRVSWETIRKEIFDKLNASQHYKGKLKPEPKCIRILTNYKVDVVPAVRVDADWAKDPISIFKVGGSEISTCPRIHADNCEAKNQATKGNFKPMVRIFKWWAQRTIPKGTAPSFYIESLLFNVTNTVFTGNLGSDFVSICRILLEQLPPNAAQGRSDIITPGERKPIFGSQEWTPQNYTAFYQHLAASSQSVLSAVRASNTTQAVQIWKSIFGDEFPSAA